MNETDDDGWAGVTWNQPSQHAPQLRAGRLRPSAHAPDGVRVRAAVCARQLATRWRRWSRTGRSTASVVVVGHAVHDRRRQRPAAAAAAQQTINVIGDAEAGLRRGRPDEQWYDPACLLAAGQRLGQHAAATPSAGRELERRRLAVPDDSVRALSQLEFRVESQNVLNHAQWGNPVTGLHRPELHADPLHSTGHRARCSWACASRSSSIVRESVPEQHLLLRLFL